MYIENPQFILSYSLRRITFWNMLCHDFLPIGKNFLKDCDQNCPVLTLEVSISHRLYSFMGHASNISFNSQLSVHQTLWWGELFADSWQLISKIARFLMALERILPSGRDRSAHLISK